MASDLTRELRKLESLARKANAEHVRAEAAVGAALDHARKAGEYLIEAREIIPYGEWMAWLRQNCTFSERTARAYVQVARRYDELSGMATVATLDGTSDRQLGLKEALHVLTGPEDPPEFLPPVPPDVIAELEALPDTASRVRASLADGEAARQENRERDRDELLENVRRRLERLAILFEGLGLGPRARRSLRALMLLVE